jgi:hypothetical protein
MISNHCYISKPDGLLRSVEKMLESCGRIPYGMHPARQNLSFTEQSIPDGMIF